jgi:hypothetical protein
MPNQAISIKQPWAALIVAGRKTVEIRTWFTRLRGPVFIHSSKISDKRTEAWKWIDTPELVASSSLLGGIMGMVNIVDCRVYSEPSQFTQDFSIHLNEPSWFLPPKMYGFVMEKPQPLPFTPLKGQTLFFSVNPSQVINGASEATQKLGSPSEERI